MRPLRYIRFVQVLWALALTGLVSGQNEEKMLPCSLVWTESSLGLAYPASAINGDPNHVMQLIIRSQPNGISSYVLGRYEPISQVAYLAFEDTQNHTALPVTEFEVLTNPNGCTVKWLSSRSSNGFLVPIHHSSQTDLVGRLTLDQQWYPGQINKNGYITAPIDDSTGLETSLKGFQYLQSFSDGLELEITDIVLDSEVAESVEFVGEDVIINKADGVVNQTIIHQKSVLETTNFTLTETWTSTKTTKVKKIFRKTKTETEISTVTKGHTIVKSVFKEFNLQRQVVVQPYSSVMACSDVKMAKGFTTDYSALARYRARGLNGEQVLAVLVDEGGLDLKNAYVANDDVVIPIRDSMSGTLAVSTSFTVVDLEAGGCNSLYR